MALVDGLHPFATGKKERQPYFRNGAQCLDELFPAFAHVERLVDIVELVDDDYEFLAGIL